MDDRRFTSMDEQGRKLSAAFASAEQAEKKSRKQPRLRLALALGGAVAVIALVAGAVLGGGSTAALSVDDAVAAVVKAAYDQPNSEPSRTLYSKTRNSDIPGPGATGKWAKWKSSALSETWSGPGAWGWYRAQRYSSNGRERYAIYNCGPTPAPTTRWETDIALRMDLPAGTKLPNNAEAMYNLLRSKIKRRGRSTLNDAVWFGAETGLMATDLNLPADQRAALIKVLGMVPDVKTLGRINDPNGKATIGFERTSGVQRFRMYFDEATSLMTYSATDGLKREIPSQRFELLESRYVDRHPNWQKRNQSHDPRHCGIRPQR